MQSVISKVKSFHRNEDGIATVWAIFWMIICFALSGLAIDTANAWKVKQILQSTADVSSVSAGMEFYFIDSDPDHPLIDIVENSALKERVKIVANMYAEANMHVARYGDVLPDESIFLGYWDGNTFTPDLDDDAIFPNAVRVITEQIDEFSLGTYFLRFVSIFDFDIRANAVVAFHLGGCEGAAILSIGNVMIEGQNAFSDFCIYGMDGVDVQASNFFDPYTIVGMPNIEEQCGSGNSHDSHCTEESMATSEGFYQALMNGLDGEEGIPASLDYKTLAAGKLFYEVDTLYSNVSKYEASIADNIDGNDIIGNDLPDSDLTERDYSGIVGLVDEYLYEASGDTGEYFEDNVDYFDATNVMRIKMSFFTDAEDETIPLIVDEVQMVDENGDPLSEPAPRSISLLEAIKLQMNNENASYASGTTYIVDCTELDDTLNYKMDLGSGDTQLKVSGIAIIGIDCDYKFDTSIAYKSSFIMTTSDSGLKGGRASVSSSNGLTLGTDTPLYTYNPTGDETAPNVGDPWCTDDKLTLLTAGSMKFGSKLQGSNFDIVAAGTVNIASGSNSDPEPHVGSSITAVGDVHLASHHTFMGCGPWAMTADDVGNRKFRISLVQ